jgi:hypothetical protein
MTTFRYHTQRAWQSALCFALLTSPAALGQSAPASAQENSAELASKIENLTKSLERTEVELAESRTEIQELRTALGQVLKRMDNMATAGTGTPNPADVAKGFQPGTAPSSEAGQGAAQISQDDWEILNARVTEQRQTKVESASKYRLKLSGLALFNAFGNYGQVDNLDLPSIAVPKAATNSNGALGASVRQSIIGLTGIGPTLFGARTLADIQMDFFGGLPSGYGGSGSGLAEIRLARIRFDWSKTSVVAGLDYPFFSPNLPTTYMSVAVPGFASAGNLWTWTPGVRVEQRFGGALSPFKVEAGFLDPGSNLNYGVNTYLRTPTATESSRQPTYAVRLSANSKSEDHSASVGVSGVYSPQRYFGDYQIPGWAGVVDWKFPLLPRTELSGQFFTGRGIDGFGGLPLSPQAPPSQAQYATVIAPTLADIGVIGGWSQLKFRVNTRSEFNVAAGTGERNSAELRSTAIWNAYVQSVPARNEMLFVNYIFKPRSDLLFSAEYRRLRTYEVFGPANSAGQVGLAVGFLF